MKRARAVQLLEGMLGRVAAAQEWPLTLVDEVHVFGSFARGALEPHDVDVVVEFTSDRKYTLQAVRAMSRGRSSDAVLRQALAAGTRGMQIQFRELEYLRESQIDTTLLWKRGDQLATALDRLNAIQPDPLAGRAEREFMLPAFENLDRWVPKPVRYLLSDWVEAGAVGIQQVQLPDGDIGDSFVRELVDERWSATSPLRRAAAGALAYLEAQGRPLRAVHLQGKDIAEEQTPVFVGIRWRYYSVIHQCLTHFGGLEWLEVPRPTLRQPLVGLLVSVLDRPTLEERPSVA